MTDVDSLGMEPSIIRVSNTADDICMDIREIAPADLHSRLTALAWQRPGFAAQLLMTLAAWVDVDEKTMARRERVDQIVNHLIPA